MYQKTMNRPSDSGKPRWRLKLLRIFPEGAGQTAESDASFCALFVLPESGLNDNLNGVERPVSFGIKEQKDRPAEIVHSLAKWKRMALKQYGFQPGEGLYTDMSAIRRDEDTDNIHSLYVDQWDWEKIITRKNAPERHWS